MKTILAELPKGKEYRLTTHGRMVKNRDDYNQSEPQRGVLRATNSGSPSRKGNLGHQEDPDCGNQNVEHAVTKPKIDKQCSQSDGLMQTEEIKSQADLDPTLECSEQMNASTPGLCEKESLISQNTDNCGNYHPVKSSDQVNAIDTTVTLKLSDDEIDMKLSIEKALKELFAKGHPI